MESYMMENIDVVIATIPVFVVTVFFLILISFRIYATSLPINKVLQFIDPDSIGMDGLS